jgi:anti-sigma regulatory factor (Ser/Thr protein kinase)
MAESVRISIDESSQSSEARRIARKMAGDTGFDEASSEQIAIVATEAGTNLLKHAGGGEILLRRTEGEYAPGVHGLELLALDRGPGMEDLDLCLENGYSTVGSAGQGLGAIVRLSVESDFYSVPGKGSAILARWRWNGASGQLRSESPWLRLGAVNVSKKGQEVCGDSWGVERDAFITTILVADGLGHGYEASLASREAVRMLHANPDLTPALLMERCHQALRSSRGAAVSVARIDRERGVLVFCGVGNVSAQIYSGAVSRQHLVSVNGTVGHQIPRLREFSYPWPEDGMLVLHSDGLSTATSLDSQSSLALRDSALIAGVLYREFSRGADDATVVVAKAA